MITFIPHTERIVSNIVKAIYITFFTLISSFGWGQVLIQSGTNLNLNSGGEIFDVEFLEESNKYVVVGNFTSINNGISRTNITILNSNFSVYNSIIFDENMSTNGPIYAVDSYRYSSGAGQWTTALYFGGDFTTVTYNSTIYPRKKVARMNIIDNGATIIGINIDPWDADLDDYGPVYEIQEGPIGRVTISGEFWGVYETGAYAVRSRVASFTGGGGALSGVVTGFDGNTTPAYDIDYIDGSFFFAADHMNEVVKTNFVATQATLNLLNTDAAYFLEELDDSLLMVAYDYTGGGSVGPDLSAVIRKSDLTQKTDHPYHDLSFPPLLPKLDMAVNNEYYFNGSNNGLHCYDHEIGSSPYLAFPIAYSPGALGYDDVSFQNRVSNYDIENGMLFFSFDNMTAVSGNSRIGAAAICLPPFKAGDFISFDTLICHGENPIFSIAACQDAEEYLWQYTGAGLDMSGDNNAEFSYSTVSPSVTLDILDEFEEGTLTVTPFTMCNNLTAGDTVYGKSNSINIWLNPLPNAYAGIDTLLTCFHDTISLHGHSDTASVIYEWKKPGELTYTLGQDFNVWDSSQYVLKVTRPSGCLAFDTVLVDIDTIKPTFDPVPLPYNITCNDSIVELLGIVNNTTDTLIFWSNIGTGDTIYSNPLLVNSVGQYQLHAQDTYNGCFGDLDSTTLVSFDNNEPDYSIVGYPQMNFFEDTDTVNCSTPILNLDCTTPTANSIAEWSTDSLGTLLFGPSATITSDSTLYVIVSDTNNGCQFSWPINIHGDFQIPEDTIYSHSSLNCSNDSLLLVGGSSWLNTTSVWTGPGITPQQDSTWINTPGYFTLTTTWANNGCSNQDSTQVIMNNSIDVFASNDTSVCDLDTATVEVNYIGSITGINYLWSNGSINQNTTYVGGIDSMAIVEVFGDGGCYGTDTVLISIPPTPDVQFTGFAPCSAGEGSIVATPISGWGPFNYSIDNGVTFQSSTSFTGLNEGIHDILVQDSLGCIYPFTATIDQNSQSIQGDFLVSTFNSLNDTAVAINTSIILSDSATWNIPGIFNILFESNDSIIFTMTDTGFYDISMEAFFGSCSSIKTKTIHVSEITPYIADPQEMLGIKAVNIYPNPNNGLFSVDVEVYQPQDVSIRLYDLVGNQYLVPEPIFYDLLLFTENIDVSISAAQAGVYYLVIISQYDVQTFEVTITP